MPLSEDSRALLQLLLGRGKSYSDISGLLGVDEDEVRSRARQALTEIAGEDPDRDLPLTDYILGQADPIARADVARRLSDDPAAAESASDLVDQLRLLIPNAELPSIPGSGRAAPKPSRKAGGPKASQAADGGASKAGGLAGSLAPAQRRLIAILLSAALLVAVLILVLTGVIGGGGDDSESNPEPASTTAVLTAAQGESGEGQVQFGFSGSDLAANLQFNGLKPNKKGQSYALWLDGAVGAFPFYQARVNNSRAITGQIAINETVICFIAADVFPRMRLSRVNNGEMEKAIEQASKAAETGEGQLPEFLGKTVLEGRISMPQEAKERILPSCMGQAQEQTPE